MTIKLAEWSNMSARDILGVVLAAGAAGAGTRLLRNAYDLGTGRDVNPPAPLPQVTPATSAVPTKVTREEAAELERQGVHVKHRPGLASAKPIGAIPAPMGDETMPAYAPTGAPAAKTAGTFLDNLALSVVGTGAAYGGWKMLDNHFDDQRRAQAQKKLDAVRGRITNLLNNTPAPVDAPLHAQMKAAEDLYFKGAECSFPGGPNGCPKCGEEFNFKEHTCKDKTVKVAFNPIGSLLGSAASGVLNLASPWAIPIGIGGTALGLAAYNESKKNNKYQQASKAIRQYYDSRRVSPPQAEIEPYVEDDADAAVTPPIGGHKVAAINEILRKRMAV